jgi:hypothetical protein
LTRKSLWLNLQEWLIFSHVHYFPYGNLIVKKNYVDAEEASHSVKIILVVGHGDNLGDDVLLCPVSSELFNLESRLN